MHLTAKILSQNMQSAGDMLSAGCNNVVCLINALAYWPTVADTANIEN